MFACISFWHLKQDAIQDILHPCFRLHRGWHQLPGKVTAWEGMYPGWCLHLVDSEKERQKTCQAYCEHIVFLSCSAEFLNIIHISCSFCCLLIPSELPALILSNSAPLGSYLLIVLMALPQKDPLQMNPQKSQFNALAQAMPSGPAIRTHPSTQATAVPLRV